MIFSPFRVAAFAVALAGIAPAFNAAAHITLETKQAPVESRYKAVLLVPHGCDDSATVKLGVRIPDAMVGVKPQPKPGWTLAIVKRDYDHACHMYGSEVTTDVKELSCPGRLPGHDYDCFGFVGYLGDVLKHGPVL